jgi:hypothetical protein
LSSEFDYRVLSGR